MPGIVRLRMRRRRPPPASITLGRSPSGRPNSRSLGAVRVPDLGRREGDESARLDDPVDPVVVNAEVDRREQDLHAGRASLSRHRPADLAPAGLGQEAPARLVVAINDQDGLPGPFAGERGGQPGPA